MEKAERRPTKQGEPAYGPIVAIVPVMVMMSVVAVMRLLDEAWLAGLDTRNG